MFFNLETWVSVPPDFHNPSSIQLLISMKVVTWKLFVWFYEFIWVETWTVRRLSFPPWVWCQRNMDAVYIWIITEDDKEHVFLLLYFLIYFFPLSCLSLCLLTNWIINSLHSLAQSTRFKDAFSHYILSLCLSPHLGVSHTTQSQLLDQFFDFLIFLLLRDGRWETQRCREGEVLSDRQSSHHHVVLETRNHHFISRISLNISCYFWCCDCDSKKLLLLLRLLPSCPDQETLLNQSPSIGSYHRVGSCKYLTSCLCSCPSHPPAPRIQTDTWSLEAEELRQSELLRPDLPGPSWLLKHPGTWTTNIGLFRS